jgi:ribosomal protein S19E (S16A)
MYKKQKSISEYKVNENFKDVFVVRFTKEIKPTKTDPSRAMVYRILNTLKAKGSIEEHEKGYKLTQAGKIARM